MAMGFGSFAGRVVATKVVATDGTGDFTDIQAAIDDLPAGGGVVYIKEGTYTLTAKLEIAIANVALIGAGRATKIAVPVLMSGLHIKDADYFHIDNLYFQGPGVLGPHFNIVIQDSSKGRVINCWSEEANFDGLYSWGTSADNVFNNNVCVNNNGGGINTSGDRNIITDNVTSSNASHGIRIAVNDNNIVSNNLVFSNGGAGIYIQNGDRNKVTGNICLLNTGNPITDTGTNTEQGHNITE